MVRIIKWTMAAAMLSITILTAVPAAYELFTRPIRSVRIVGKFEHVSREALSTAIHQSINTGFFDIDVDAVRAQARQLPWVRDISVQRVWPDALTITVSERVAVARWNTDALLENDATIFHPKEGINNYSYTQLIGPRGKQVYLLDQYKRLATTLGTLAGGIVRLDLSRQGVWQIEFANGMTLVPGMDLNVSTLKTFAQTARRVMGEDLARVERIDLRYANGFAVRWRMPGVARVEGDKG